MIQITTQFEAQGKEKTVWVPLNCLEIMEKKIPQELPKKLIIEEQMKAIPPKWRVDVTNFKEDNHNWSVTCWDDISNYRTSSTYIFTNDYTDPSKNTIANML